MHTTIQPTIQFAAGDRLDQHRTFFGGLGDVTVGPAKNPPRPGENWRVAIEWDASLKVRKRPDGTNTNTPLLITWSPQGDHLFTSCDAFGLSSWLDDGRWVGSHTEHHAYGHPIRCFVSPCGKYIFQQVRTGYNYWHIFSRSGALLAILLTRRLVAAL